MDLGLLEISRAMARAGDGFELEVLDPDATTPRVTVEGVAHVRRPYRVWIELADRLGFRIRTPIASTPPLVRLRFDRIVARDDEGIDSKLADPGFVIDFGEALDRVELPANPRILDLGVHTGDELALLLALRPALADDATIVAVDRDAAALAIARARFPRVRFVEADLDRPLDLGEFDLVIAIATLQSTGLDDRELLRRITQRHLAPHGSVILGVPNCRVIGGELSHGARIPNFRQPELGLVIKDVAFYRKYLQQHARRVFVTGHHYLLVTAVPA